MEWLRVGHQMWSNKSSWGSIPRSVWDSIWWTWAWSALSSLLPPLFFHPMLQVQDKTLSPIQMRHLSKKRFKKISCYLAVNCEGHYLCNNGQLAFGNTLYFFFTRVPSLTSGASFLLMITLGDSRRQSGYPIRVFPTYIGIQFLPPDFVLADLQLSWPFGSEPTNGTYLYLCLLNNWILQECVWHIFLFGSKQISAAIC